VSPFEYSITAAHDLHVHVLHADLQGGMGCSNGVIGIGLMRDLLQVRAVGLEHMVCRTASASVSHKTVDYFCKRSRQVARNQAWQRQPCMAANLAVA
jgi:hypothetical protein